MASLPPRKEQDKDEAGADQSLRGLFAPPGQQKEGSNVAEHAPLVPKAKDSPAASHQQHLDGEPTAAEQDEALSSLFAPADQKMTMHTSNETRTEQNEPRSTLSGLFTPPPLALERGTTIQTSNETTTLLSEPSSSYNDRNSVAARRSSATEAISTFNAMKQQRAVAFPEAEPRPSRFQQFVQMHLQPTTFAGSIMFLLYHVVFCLTMGSAIIRPRSSGSILGVMAKMSVTGILFSGPYYINRLGHDIPALYPSVDLFLAPFIAEAAVIVDESLSKQYDGAYPDDLFFGTFSVLIGIGMFLAGAFLRSAATFKLANLGTYLPFAVLCGFFSAVGVLMWALAFQVDTAGKSWKTVFFSGDPELIWNSCLHHFPSLIVGILMNRLGPKNPFFVILLIVVTLVSFYVIMFCTGTTLKDAEQAKWFWSVDELIYKGDINSAGGESHSWMLAPTPFGSFGAIFTGWVNWMAVREGLGNMAALAFLYLLRSSIHASAMKKNVGNLVMRIPVKKKRKEADLEASEADKTTSRADNTTMASRLRQSIRILNMSLADKETLRMRSRKPAGGSEAVPTSSVVSTSSSRSERYEEIRAKPSRKSLEEIFVEYGYALFVVSLCGGFGCCPTVATSNTMYAIGADGVAPQYGSVLLLLVFYLTDFELVRFIPKTAFSSLLVLGAVDTLAVWFFGAFRKTLDVTEWLVVPMIVGFSLFVGFLNAVFLGIAISMFVFVASFFRVGVVKFNATGIEIRSRIERSVTQSAWLDENGDYIQILVLQNFLFFGNASSILSYIATMFEEIDVTESQRLDFAVPPVPKVLIVDLSLVTGMDTSSTDIFADIQEMCSNNDCKLFLCGLSPRMRKGLALGGVKPAASGPRSKSTVRFFSDLDAALGKAEDALIEQEMVEETNQQQRQMTLDEEGLQRALLQIDELHGIAFSRDLQDLQRYTTPIDLEAGECLFACDGGIVQERQRGLFFVESGLLKVEKDSTQSLTHTRTRSSTTVQGSAYTLKNQHARMGSMARQAALAKGTSVTGLAPQNLRLARIGPGWVCGMIENASGTRPSGVTTAVTKCRLHHLPFHRLEQLEKENPVLALNLYKMLSHILAQREEIRIEQLTTLHNIMSSPAHSKPISRAALHAMR